MQNLDWCFSVLPDDQYGLWGFDGGAETKLVAGSAVEDARIGMPTALWYYRSRGYRFLTIDQHGMVQLWRHEPVTHCSWQSWVSDRDFPVCVFFCGFREKTIFQF